MISNKSIEAKSFRSFRKELGLNQKQIALEMELTQGYISDIETGRTSLSYKILKQMFDKWAYSPLFHMTGVGPMIIHDHNSIKNDINLDLKKLDDCNKKGLTLQKEISTKNEEIAKLQRELSNAKDKIITLLESR